MKTVLVTGGARGIGRGISEFFLKKGANVIVNYNNSRDEALKLEKEYRNCFAVKADVSKKEEVEELVEKAILKFGFIDTLINNAGIALTGLLQDNKEEDFDNLFNINVKGTFLVTKELLAYMIREKRGTIINISSMWGETGGACEVLYSSTKAAIIGFTKALAKEVGPSGIRVNAISPGVIETDMLSNLSEDDLKALAQETPLLRNGKCEDIAKAAYFLASSDSDFITGQIIGVNGGLII